MRSRTPLTRARILEVALALVDAEGLDALSMRRLGGELGVEAMSLYNHVPSKAALLDGLHELILESVALPPAAAWVESLRAGARSFRAALAAHPNALPLFATRPAVTEGSLRHVESALALLRRAGLDAGESAAAFQALVSFVVGHTLAELAPAAGADRSRPRYETLSSDELPNVIDAAEALAQQSEDEGFELGLEIFLIGLAARAKARRRRA
jgi:AcrR family transcriptional regulator